MNPLSSLTLLVVFVAVAATALLVADPLNTESEFVEEKRGGARPFLEVPKRGGARPFLGKRAGGRGFRFLEQPPLNKRAGGRAFYGGNNYDFGFYSPSSFGYAYEKKAMPDYLSGYYWRDYKRGGARPFEQQPNYWLVEEKEKKAGARTFPVFNDDPTDSRQPNA